jgi:amidase
MTRNATLVNRRKVLVKTGQLGAVLTVPSLAGGTTSSSVIGNATEITQLTASQLSLAIKHGQISCVEVMQSYLERIAKYNPTYNAIVSLQNHGHLLKQAAAADTALRKGNCPGWMHGMPHAAKDLSGVEGIISTSGSPILTDNIAKSDSIFVERIRQQGEIFIGKTSVPRFGLSSQSYNPVFGVTRNAHHPALCAGRSGGAAVGLASQMLPAADLAT